MAARLEAAGYVIRVFRERPGLVEAEIRRGEDAVRMEWARDSAYRFFPLVAHGDLGLTLHPFELATAKVRALVGRVEARDFVDTLTCDRDIQPLGDLAWAVRQGPGVQPLEHPRGGGPDRSLLRAWSSPTMASPSIRRAPGRSR